MLPNFNAIVSEIASTEEFSVGNDEEPPPNEVSSHWLSIVNRGIELTIC